MATTGDISVSDDRHVQKVGIAAETFDQLLTSGNTSSSATAATGVAARSWSSGTTQYTVRQLLLSFDTSGIPDDATIDSATLKMWMAGRSNNESFDLVGEYHAWDDADPNASWVRDPGNNAFTLALASTTNNADNTFTLTNVSNISKTGVTKFRIGISGGTPTLTNTGTFRFLEDVTATGDEPRLEVIYTPAASGWSGRTPPDAIVSMVGLTGAVTDVDEDPDSPDANWLVVS